MAERKAAQRRTTGRVTPKGAKGEPTKVDAGIASGRYTPPIPREQKVSPLWVPVLMFAFLGLGVLLIILNYVGVFWDTSNTWLLVGLGLITAGFVTATNYH